MRRRNRGVLLIQRATRVEFVLAFWPWLLLEGSEISPGIREVEILHDT